MLDMAHSAREGWDPAVHEKSHTSWVCTLSIVIPFRCLQSSLVVLAYPTSTVLPCRCNNPHSTYVQNTLVGAFAVLLKRGWLGCNEGQQQALLEEVEGTAANGQNQVARKVSIQLLEVRASLS